MAMEAASDTRKAVVVRIDGRVQGVWYRGWTVDAARRLGLDGWVRNRADGTVEALFAGPKAAVNAMLEACWRGPPAAMVTELHPRPADDPGRVGFRQLPTS